MRVVPVAFVNGAAVDGDVWCAAHCSGSISRTRCQVYGLQQYGPMPMNSLQVTLTHA